MWAAVGIVVLLAGGLIAALAMGGGNEGAAAAPTTVTSTTEPGGDTSAPSSSSTTEVTPAPSTTSSTEAPTTTAVVTTTEPVDPNAPPDNSADDPLQGLVAVHESIDWLSRNPSLESFQSYFDESCPCYDVLEGELLELIDNDWTYDDEGITLVAVMEIDSIYRKEEDRSFRFVDVQLVSRLVDSAGSVIRERLAWPLSVNEMRIQRGDDGLWRVKRWEREGPIEEFAARTAAGELLTGWEAWDYLVENELPGDYAYAEFEDVR